ncbi:MAG: DUF6580 family putative transport protein [Devosia sp.]
MTNSERLAIALILLGVLSRLLPHPPNVTAVVGVSLLAAYAIRHPLNAAMVPLSVMVISDLVLGWHSSAIFTYAGMLAATFIGRWLITRLNPLRIGGAALLSSLAFFLISNFGVWVGGYYGYSLEGLYACYVEAIPFFGYSLVGDLGSTAILFGIFVLGRRMIGEPAAQPG